MKELKSAAKNRKNTSREVCGWAMSITTGVNASRDTALSVLLSLIMSASGGEYL